MALPKRHQKAFKPPAQTRSRTTRSSKGRILSDPAKNNQLLTDQLRSLGLYAAPTLGDGNCLFRALSDQLYGSPSHHLQLRADICDWIEAHTQRYEPFCEDERGLGAHLRCMREQGTYGGHLELSAFAHFAQRNVKVIQPGLVYVIEWSGGAATDVIVVAAVAHNGAVTTASTPGREDSSQDERERRRLRRDQKRAKILKADEVDADQYYMDDEDAADPALGAVYVAYHDWEHFSSIRNLRGPHSGLPYVVETPVEAVASPTATARTPTKLKIPPSCAKPKVEARLALKHSPSHSVPYPENKRLTSLLPSSSSIALPTTPSQIPLPGSRSPSPASTPLPEPIVFRADVSPPTPYNTQTPSFPFAPQIPSTASIMNLRVHRSPKRSFDESSGSSASSQSVAKRTRSSKLTTATVGDGPHSGMDVIDNESIDLESTPGLSAPGSSAGSSSAASSPASSPLPTTPPATSATPPPEHADEIEQQTVQAQSKPLTRRQRKAMGLPKPKSALVAKRMSAGKIVIPGGKYNKKMATRGRGGIREADDDDDDEEDEDKAEWKTNGTGRVDVRGFRELKI